MNSDILSQIASSRPTIKFCSLFNGLSPLWDYSLHSHPYMELIYRKKGFGKTALLNDTQNFVFFDTLVYPMGCWHQDKFEASEENEAYCLWLDIPCVPLDKPIQVQDHGGRLEFFFLLYLRRIPEFHCFARASSSTDPGASYPDRPVQPGKGTYYRRPGHPVSPRPHDR